MMNSIPGLFATFVIGVAASLLNASIYAAPGDEVANVDLTKGGKIPADANHDWNLGATGARGWMFSKSLSTAEARQIAVTEVHPFSPADSVLMVGDVIIGVAGKPFASDPRVEFGKALTQAESEAGKGLLALRIWRDGKTGTVRLRLPVLGSYSQTAPYNCEKSERIFEQGCEALAKRMASRRYRGNPMTRSLNAMALLASGDERYLPLIQHEAKWAAGFKSESFATWWYGYTIIFLSEYVIETGDTSVMPGLKRLAMEAASGQSIVGSWGHRFAKPDGILMGYGMMNAPGIPMTTGLVLAREAGIDDPGLDQAIEKSVRLIRFYVDKGSIPYGDHAPWIKTHDDNGKNGMAAVLFNLLGDREAAEYFSRMSIASHGNERDGGHTGNFLNITWAMPGINPSGPNATGAWMDVFGAWYFDLARQHDGTYLHQGPPQSRPDSFRNWDSTGANLLAYAMPLKNLRITGKGKQAVPSLSARQAKGLIEDGRDWNYLDKNSFYEALTDEQLLQRLTNWSPIVRERAAMALKQRRAQVQSELIELLRSDDRYTRYGACQALKVVRGNNAAAVPVLIQTLESEDMWLRILAAEALAGIGSQARPAIPAMLKRLADSDADNDPRGMEQRYLSFAIFNRRGGLLSRSIAGVDRDLLRDAVRAGLANEDGRARGAFSSVYDKLSLQEIRPLLPAILDAVVESAPSGIMFASEIRNEGLRLLAKHNVEEGMQAGVDYLAESWDQWGAGTRTKIILEALASYGANAQAIIPQLERIAEQMAAADKKKPERSRNHHDQLVRETIQSIRESTKRPDLIKAGAAELSSAAPTR